MAGTGETRSSEVPMESKMIDGMRTAFLDRTWESNLAYKPMFLSNNYQKGQKVLSSIEDELLHCDRFYISVAFITLGGITPILQTLAELRDRQIPGEILTTDYLYFSDPKALKKLDSFPNITLRMYRTQGGNKEGFHTKGYIFQNKEIYRIIIGSSNLTLNALTKNKEWNIRTISANKGEYSADILSEFKDLWNSSEAIDYDRISEDYAVYYKIAHQQKTTTKIEHIPSLSAYTLQPNSMQVEVLQRIRAIREQGKKRALLISATGTGKTYASAFAMRDENQKRVLFLIHREQIARKSMESYQNVFGSRVTYGILSGNKKDLKADYLFATVQTLSKDEVLHQFERNAFDTIIVDEVHHAGAGSYQKIIQYFSPKFLLGMTATPERTDGYDIYSLFDHNIAYEIRLQQALEENLLCPFHYFGITDLEIEGTIADDRQTEKTIRLEDFQYLTSEQRVNYIIEKAEYYGYSGDRVKGIIFVSRKEIGREISNQMNRRGKKTIFLSGENTQEEREKAVEALTRDDISASQQLDYILTVDIFNEGVDIPEINQVILLRPTQSPIIFVQQLGRGLRKSRQKEYVVILDFIGNYTNNYMIPIALSGDRTYNKDNIRRYVSEGSRVIPGSSTIHFDEISRKRIFASIDKAKTNSNKFLLEEYKKVKYQLGRIPTIMDFEELGSVDVTKYFDKFGSYYAFLIRYEPDYKIRLPKREEEVITFVSKKLGHGKRAEELEMLKEIMDERNTIPRLQAYRKYINASTPAQKSAVRNLTNQFVTQAEQKSFQSCVLLEVEESGRYCASDSFMAMLSDSNFANMMQELVSFCLKKHDTEFNKPYQNTNFQLYQKYSYEDVCLLLNWKTNLSSIMNGYFYDPETKALPVFINYHKSEDAIRYQDRFLSNERFIGLSKHPRKVTSSDADHFYKRTQQDRENHIYLFVRKNKDDQEAKEFYFLGEINAEGNPKEITMTVDIKDKTGKVIGVRQDDAFEVEYRLDVPVREDLYHYLIDE